MRKESRYFQFIHFVGETLDRNPFEVNKAFGRAVEQQTVTMGQIARWVEEPELDKIREIVTSFK